MKNLRLMEWAVVLIIFLCAGVAIAIDRAAAQPSPAPAPPAARAALEPPPSRETPPPPAATVPQGAEDATVAPDKKESADNNVSFPTDI
ncbi:MAG TPA: hypothetical protein VEH54_09315 [Steroidobacteraceae bacterium]|nr:hypothetical protein [Steroidobacteraceae bacterium]